MEQSCDLRPTGAKVRTGQSAQELAFGGVPTVRHQVNFQKAGLLFIPFGKRAYGNDGFEQAARFGRAQAVSECGSDAGSDPCWPN